VPTSTIVLLVFFPIPMDVLDAALSYSRVGRQPADVGA
jgi:hypothetical protein